MNYPNCPVCHSNLTYHDGSQLVCPECAYEWLPEESSDELDNQVVLDANGTPLNDGDSVILIKDLKIKGSSQVIKQGTKVKSIRLQDGDHNIACKIDGSAINLKSEFVKNHNKMNKFNRYSIILWLSIIGACTIQDIPSIILQAPTEPSSTTQQPPVIIVQSKPESTTKRSGLGLIRQNNYCLDIHAANDKDVILYPCHGKANQLFTFETDNTIRQNGQCLDVAGNERKDGTPVILYPCTGKDNQKWYQDGQAIRSVSSGKCLDTKDKYVKINTCKQSPTQQFQ